MHIEEAYKILGLDTKSAEDDVKKASRKLMAKYHPDVNKSPQAEKKFKEVNEAVQTIKSYKENPFISSEFTATGTGFDFFNFNVDMFNDIFGSQQGANPFKRKNRTPSHKPDVQIQIVLTFKESIFGCEKEITYDRYVHCDTCKTSGITATNSKCTVCNGRGVAIRHMTMGNMTVRQQATCEACQGTGRACKPCDKCAGEGSTLKKEKRKVKIPSGIKTGDVLSEKYSGNSYGNRYGQLFMLFNVLEDKNYMRVNNDIHLIKHISLLDALRGRSIDVYDLAGEKYKIKIPNGIKNSDLIRISTAGVPKTEGSFCLRIMVDYPKESENVSKLIELLEKDEN